MRSKTLVVVLAVLLSLVAAYSAFAADTKADQAASFDQKEVLMKFWTAPDDAVVGTVNGEKITKRDVLKQLWFWNAPSALQDLMNQKMIEQGADKAGIEMTWADKQKQVTDALSKTGAANLDQLLNQYRITWYRFMTATKLSGLMEKLVQKQVSVTDADYADWIKARHILIKFPADEKDKEKQKEIAKKKIDEIAAKVKNGEDFAKLADEYSEDPGNERDGKKQGGDLGWFSRGRMVQEFENAAFKLKPGEVSEPVETYYGYHLIKLEKTGKEASAAEKADLKAQILEKKTPMEMQRVYGDLQAKTKMDNMLMPPQPEMPTPAMAPRQPSPPGASAPNTAPKPAPAPAPKPAAKPAAPPASAKPADAPPPPPPAQ